MVTHTNTYTFEHIQAKRDWMVEGVEGADAVREQACFTAAHCWVAGEPRRIRLAQQQSCNIAAAHCRNAPLKKDGAPDEPFKDVAA